MARIYALADPRTNAVRYIGQTRRTLRQRLAVHLCLARKGSKTYSGRWLGSLLKLNLEPVMVLLEETDDPNGREKFWIALFLARGARLTNVTEGGDFSPYLGPAGPLSPEHKAKISAALTGTKRPNAKGHPTSPETRAKLSALKMGVKQQPPTPETRAKLSAAHKGKKRPPEHVAKVTAGVRKAVAEGRLAPMRGDDNPRRKRPECYPVGEAWGNAKLTAAIVAEDRRRYKAGGITSVQLAKERGVNQAVIYNALIGKTWKHVTEPPFAPPTDPVELRAWKTKQRSLATSTRIYQPHTAETKEKIRSKATGRIAGPPTPETRRKIGDARRGKLTKYSDEQVREIRQRYAAGEGSTAWLARQYGASQQWVASIVSNKARSHVV